LNLSDNTSQPQVQAQQHFRLDIVLLVLAGFLLYIPLLDYFGPLSQGDNGRDLYAGQEVLRGKMPYQHFSWVYGPLMPYYLAALYKIFGTSIQTLIFAKIICRLATGVFFYLTARTILPRSLALMSTFWVWTFYRDFLYTINHTLGVVFMTAACCAIMFYWHRNQTRYLWAGLTACFLLTLTKLNFGFGSLAAFVLGSAIINAVYKRPLTGEIKRFYLTALAGVPLASAGVYWFFLHPLPSYEISQALPYASQFMMAEIPWTTGLQIIGKETISNFNHYPWDTALVICLFISLIKILTMWYAGKLSTEQKKQFLVVMSLLLLFFLMSMHEYLRNAIPYRKLWARPFNALLSFYLIHTAFAQSSAWFRRGILVGMLFLILYGQLTLNFFLEDRKTFDPYMNTPRGQVYFSNPPEWIQTVAETTAYLNRHLRPDETFLAMPYDPLYYFLTGRSAPTRHLAFIACIHVPPPQEEDVMRSLEKHNVRYVLLSSRIISKETGVGFLGRDYCPLLKKYFDDHFETVAEFGDWTQDPDWSNFHATRIIKRK
jgi:hypothetical protein